MSGKKSFKDFLREELNIIDGYYDPNYYDAYTFVFNEIANSKGDYMCLAMDKLGYYSHEVCSYKPNNNNAHLGKKIDLNKLPKNIKDALIAYKKYLEYIDSL